MTNHNQNQSNSNWTSISREDLKDAELKSIQRRRNRKIRSLLIVLLLIGAAVTISTNPFGILSMNNQKVTSSETQPEKSDDVALSTGPQDSLNCTYAAGFCGVDMLEKAIQHNRTDFDYKALPSTEEILEKKLEAYGHPYVLDGDRFFIFYFQDHDQPWSDMEHGESTVAASGCGTLCLSMVLTSLTGNIEAYTPDKLVKFLETEHIAAPNLSENSIPVTNRCLNTGIQITKYEDEYDTILDLDLVDETLEKGGYIILDQTKYANGLYSDTFASRNHYIVIRGGNQKDGYYIANPIWIYSSPDSEADFAPQNTTRIPADRFSALYYYTILPAGVE